MEKVITAHRDGNDGTILISFATVKDYLTVTIELSDNEAEETIEKLQRLFELSDNEEEETIEKFQRLF